MATFIVCFWVFPSILTTILAVTMEMIERKSGENNEFTKLTAKELSEILFLMYTPFLQFAMMFYLIRDLLIMHDAKREMEKIDVKSLHENLNELFECNECGLVQRMHQLTAEHYQHCCGDDYRDTMRKVSNPRIHEFALASGLTPLMTKSEVKQQLKEKKSEKTNNQKMQNLLEKTEYVQKQNAIYLKKEYAKLEAMNAEKERRKEMALQLLDGNEKEELLQTIALFDELYVVEMEKLAVLEKNNEETLASLKGKLPA